MAGVKISALPAIGTPAATDVFPVVQSGVTYKESVTQLGTLLLLLTGGTMTGALVLSGDPTSNLEAATKQYVDAVATGLNIQGSCSAATTANLAGYVYDNGVAGVGATLTAGSNGAFSVDGVSPSLNDRILVKDQTAPAQNGIYTLTQVGDGSNPAILTRATDFDTPAEIQPGDYVLVLNGTVNASTAWVQTATVTAVGTDAIVWDQFSADVNTIITNIQDNSYLYAVDTGAANAYVAALSPAVSTLPEGMVVLIKIANTNTTASTLNLNGLGADSILDETGAALKPGDLTANAYVMFVRTASNWRIINRNIERRIQDSSFTRAIDTGVADAYVAALIPALPAYTFGVRVDLLVANSNTGASTINVNGLGAKSIIKSDGSALSGGEMVANHVSSLIYNGTEFEIINLANVVTSSTSPQTVQGRLTLTTGTPVTTSDVTAATTLYFTPYVGNYISLYNGSTWILYQFSEVSIAVPSTTATLYDVYIYDNAGTLTLELVAWTNDTTRATALALQDGVYVKTGDATRRYLGNIRTTGVSGQTEDSIAFRYLWNYYNRKARPMKVVEATATWNYSTASFRQTNASTANQLDFIIGVSEDIVWCKTIGLWSNNSTDGATCFSGIGLDNTTTTQGDITSADTSQAANGGHAAISNFNQFVAEGRHYLAWLEYGAGANTQTWFGDGSGSGVPRQQGIIGRLFG